MPNWRTIEETDLAANVSQSEIDAYRADGALDGSDPVRQLLVSTVDAVRGYISCNGSVRMGPSGTIPRGLVIPAMDYAMGKVLNRIGVPLSEDRREALRKAQELFEKIAKGEITPESYSEDGEIDESTRPATSPIADDGPRRTLGGGLWSIAAALLAVLSASAKTFDVDISTGRPAASNEAFYHGETIEFRAVRGRSAVTNIEYSCIWYTTNNSSSVASGEGGWWKTDGLVFHPTNDCGAAAYRFFLEGRDEIGRDWHANGLLRFLPSPGFEPSAVQLPVQTLDFSKVTVINPPWGDTDLTPATNYTDEVAAALSAADAVVARDATNYTDAAIAALPEPVAPDYSTGNTQLVATIEAVAPAPGNYATVSNRAMSALQEHQPLTNYYTKGQVDSSLSGKANDSAVVKLSGDQEIGGNKIFTGLVTVLEEEPNYIWNKIYASGFVIGGDGKSPQYVSLPYASGTLALTSDIPNISGKADKADVAAAAVAATNYTDEAIGDISFPVRSVNQKTGAVVLSAADVGAYPSTDGQALAGQVTAIGAHINGEDAKVMVTNYNSSTHLPEVEFDINVSNNWLVVWREMTRWNWFLGDLWNPFTNSVSTALANKAEKEYAFFDGVTGEPAPDGFFWISQPRVAICAGAAYQRYVDTAGEVWVLESNGMVADINGTTNGYFRISDDKGNVQFEIVKGDSRTVAAAPGALTRSSVMGVTHWHTTYMVTNAVSAPKAMFCRDIANPEWYAEDDAGCPCNVDWTHPSEGIYVCEWWPQGDEPKMFMRSQYGQGSESRIVQNAPVEMQTIVIGGVKGTLGTATINGITVLTFTPGTP